jgi:DNA-binding Xre family transcriptional regulator
MPYNGATMIRTRIKEEADQQELTLNLLIRRSGVSSSSARRLWYNTADGRAEGAALESIHIPTLEAVARVLGVEPLNLLEYVEDN